MVREIRNAVEQAPGAEGALKVRRIFRLPAQPHQASWQGQVERLSKRFSHPEYPKPDWRSLAIAHVADERMAEVVLDRDQTLDYLFSMSRSECEGVWSARVFHGVQSHHTARVIADTGFSSTVQGSKGWFGEGVYVSTMPTYALRYCWMTEFWNVPGCVGYLVSARACFSQLYPVTQADNIAGLTKPGMKGKPVGGWSAPGARGADAHFTRVRSFPPHDDEPRRTYHACLPGEHPQGNELVLSEQTQVKPECIVEVEVAEDPLRLRVAQMAAERHDRDLLLHREPMSPRAQPTIPMVAADMPVVTSSRLTFAMGLGMAVILAASLSPARSTGVASSVNFLRLRRLSGRSTNLRLG